MITEKVVLEDRTATGIRTMRFIHTFVDDSFHGTYHADFGYQEDYGSRTISSVVEYLSKDSTSFPGYANLRSQVAYPEVCGVAGFSRAKPSRRFRKPVLPTRIAFHPPAPPKEPKGVERTKPFSSKFPLSPESYTRLKNKYDSKMKRVMEIREAKYKLRQEVHQYNLRNYERRLATFNKSRDKYNSAFKKRMDAYLVRLAEWNRKTDFGTNNPYKVRKVTSKVASSLFLQNENPYVKTRIITKRGSGIETSWGHIYCGTSYTGGYYPSNRGVLSGVMFEIAQNPPTVTVDSNVGQTLLQSVLQPLLPMVNELKLETITKYRDRLKDQDVNLLVMGGERAQTLSLFVEAYKRLHSLITVKRDVFKSLKRYVSDPKAISNDYLAFKFGVMPLLSDIDGLMKKLAEFEYSAPTSSDNVVIVKSGKKKILNDVVKLGFNNYRVYGTITYNTSVKYHIEDATARSFQRFGLVNLADVAWELTPWSFVVDWFVPIGDLISSLTDDVGLTFWQGTETVTYNLYFEPTTEDSRTEDPLMQLYAGNTASETPYLPATPPIVPNTGDAEYSDILGVTGWTKVFVNVKAPDGFNLYHKSRSVMISPHQTSVVVTKNPLSWTHGLEALSLLAQKFKRHL